MVVKIHQNKLKLKTNFSISHGSYSFRDSIVVELAAKECKGFGETVVIDYYGIEKDALLEGIQEVAGLIKNWNVNESPFAFHAFLQEFVPDKPFIHVAFDCAYWDLKARIENLYLSKYIGVVDHQKEVLSSITIGINEDAHAVKLKLEGGWPVIKLKMKNEENSHFISKLYWGNKSFGIDANGSWDVTTWNKLYPQLADHACMYIEQPFSKNNEYHLKKLKQSIRIPILADESVSNLKEMKDKSDLYDGYVLKLVKCGGITPVLEMINYANHQGKLLLAGCMTESSVGISNMYALLKYFDYADLDGAQLIENDPFQGVTLQNNGTFKAPKSMIGNGVKDLFI